jgi:hypothetical protein
MRPATGHELPAKRVKLDEAGGVRVPTLPPASYRNEDSDEEEPGFVNGAVHGSDLYLDTVRIA